MDRCAKYNPASGQSTAVDNYYSPYGANVGSSYTTNPLTGTTYTMSWPQSMGVNANWWGIDAIDLIGSPNPIVDSTWNANNGTPSDVSSATGEIYKGLSFNGSTSVVTLPTGGSLTNVTQNITVSSWVNITTNKNWNQLIASQWSTTGLNGWNLFTDSGGIAYFGVSVGTTQTLTSSSALSTGTWYYLTGTYDGSTVKLYVNGALVSTASVSSVVFTTPPNTGFSAVGTSSMNGTLDEMRISNYVNSPGWIQTEYNNQSNPGPGSGDFIEPLGNEETKIYAPTLAQLMRHGQFFNTQGQIQPFTF